VINRLGKEVEQLDAKTAFACHHFLRERASFGQLGAREGD
jgi:hypothetical protein